MLQEGCRDCLFARNLLREVIKNELDPAGEAERINNECTGWQGEENPQESLINAKGGPAMGMATSIEENCAHPLS
jgi:hypothetical protein